MAGVVARVVLRGLAAAGRAIYRAAKNPAVRRAAVRAAKKAGQAFSRFAQKSKQMCQKAWRRLRGVRAPKSVEEILQDPKVLSGKTPKDIEQLLARSPNWKVETLRKGSHKGQGWILREYTPQGNPTGRMIQWHPGGGHHGPQPYWKVSTGEGGAVRVGPQFGE